MQFDAHCAAENKVDDNWVMQLIAILQMNRSVVHVDDLIVRKTQQNAICGAANLNRFGGHAVSNEQVSGQPIISELGTDDDIVELVDMFVSELPKRVEAMRQAVEENDLESLKRFVHQLKGAAGGYGFPTITEGARELEQAIEPTEGIENVRQQVEALADLCQRARAK